MVGTKVGRASPRAAGASGETPGATAASTSCLVTVPLGPVGVNTRRSTPRSFASFRTGGFARTGPVRSACVETADAAAPGAVAVGVTGDVESAVAVDPAWANSEPPSRLRGRRFASVVRGPYPTRTG